MILPTRIRPPGTRACPTLVVLAIVFLLAGCDGPQSALAPGSANARELSVLFWWMTGGAGLIWLLVFGTAIYSSRPGRRTYKPESTRWLIIAGGAIVPTIVLGILLSYSLQLLADLRSPGPVKLSVAVSGEQWWWRVSYLREDAEPIELANEIRLPAGQRVEFILTSPDVIHSFWIPSLGGKVDMIPGRTTRLVLHPDKLGVFRGACAEYCGTSHAFMNFEVVVLTQEEFDRWLAGQATEARSPQSELAARGADAFLSNGCGACHRIRGTSAQGSLGPDLTHVGSRLTIGAGMLPSDRQAFLRWISHTEAIKPDVRMPSFGVLPEEDRQAIAAYLSELL